MSIESKDTDKFLDVCCTNCTLGKSISNPVCTGCGKQYVNFRAKKDTPSIKTNNYFFMHDLLTGLDVKDLDKIIHYAKLEKKRRND